MSLKLRVYVVASYCAEGAEIAQDAAAESAIFSEAHALPARRNICPLLFTADVIKKSLNFKAYEKDKRGSWCQEGLKFPAPRNYAPVRPRNLCRPAPRSASDPSHGTDDVAG